MGRSCYWNGVVIVTNNNLYNIKGLNHRSKLN